MEPTFLMKKVKYSKGLPERKLVHINGQKYCTHA